MIGEGTVIKNGSRIVGPLIIGKECVIGPDANIGPNISIGDNSKLSRCHVKNSIIMPGCNINGNFKIRDSIIAFNSEIIKTDNADSNVFLLGEGTKISL